MTESFASSRLLLDAGISMLVSVSWMGHSHAKKAPNTVGWND